MEILTKMKMKKCKNENAEIEEEERKEDLEYGWEKSTEKVVFFWLEQQSH